MSVLDRRDPGRNPHFEERALYLLEIIAERQAILIERQSREMATLQDLTTAFEGLSTEVDEAVQDLNDQTAKINQLVAQGQGATPEQLQTLLDQVNATKAKLTTGLANNPDPGPVTDPGASVSGGGSGTATVQGAPVSIPGAPSQPIDTSASPPAGV